MTDKASDLKPGNVINNGFHDIEIIEKPRWNETHGRWFVKGYRWLPSRKKWDHSTKIYGFREFKLVK